MPDIFIQHRGVQQNDIARLTNVFQALRQADLTLKLSK